MPRGSLLGADRYEDHVEVKLDFKVYGLTLRSAFNFIFLFTFYFYKMSSADVIFVSRAINQAIPTYI